MCTLYRYGQAVADAYYVLSDSKRRSEYDALYESKSKKSSDPNSSANFFNMFANMFGGAAGGTTGTAEGERAQRPDANNVFGDVFEDVSLLHLSSWWFIEPVATRSFFVQKSSGDFHCGHTWEQRAVRASDS